MKFPPLQLIAERLSVQHFGRRMLSTLLLIVMLGQVSPLEFASAQAQPSTANPPSFLSDGRVHCTWSGNVQSGITYYLEVLSGSTTSVSSAALVGSGWAGTDQFLAVTPSPSLQSGKYYFCKVWAYKAATSSYQGYTVSSPSQYTAPSGPTIPSVPSTPSVSLSGTTLTITWSSVSGATAYDVQIYKNGSLWNTVSNVSGTSTSYSVSGSSSGTTFYAKVSAKNSAGSSNYSNQSSTVTYTIPATAPTSVSLSFSGTTASMSWSGAQNASYYTYTLKQGGSSGSTVASGNVTYTAADYSPFVASTTYWLQVCTNGSLCTSTSSTSPQPVPPAPSGLNLTRSDTTLQLSWNTVGGYAVSGYDYEIFRDGTSVSARNDMSGTSDTYNATPNSTYTFHVRARNASGAGAWSSMSSSVFVPYPTPSTPTGAAITPSGNSLNLTWNSVSYATTYIVTPYRGGVAQPTVSSSTNSLTLTGTPGYSYSFTVQASNTTGNSGQSATSNTVTLAPSVPNNLTLSFASTVATMGWNAVNGTGITYDVEVFENGNPTPVATLTNLSSNAATYTGTPAASYYFHVRAKNSGGTTAYSANSATVSIPATPPTVSNFLLRSANTASEVQPGWTNTPNVTFTFTGTDVTSCTFNGATTSICNPTGNGTATLSGVGPFTASVTVSNASGTATSNTQTIKLDATAPTATLRTSGGDGPTPISPQAIQQGGSVTGIAIQCNDEIGGSGCNSSLIQYHLGSPTAASCSTFTGGWVSGAIVPPITTDTTICGRIYDNAGNVAYTTAHTIYFDTTDPTITNVTINQNSTPLNSIGGISYTTSPSLILVSFGVNDDQNGNLGNNNLSQCSIQVGDTVIAHTPADCVAAADGTRTITIPAGTLHEGANTLSIEIADASGRTTSVTQTIFLDTTSPSVTVTGLTTDNPNYRTTPVTDLSLSCNDGAGSGCVPSSLQYFMSPTLPANCADIPEALWVNYNGTSLPAIANIQQLCVRASDVAGTRGYSPRYTVSVDLENPIISAITLSSGSIGILPQDSIYFVRVDHLTVGFTATDSGTGLNQCSLIQSHGETSTESSVACVDGVAATGQVTALAQGENLVTVHATDKAGRVATQTLHVFFDNTPPSITGTFSANANESNHTITLTLPTSFDDSDGSGVDHVTISVLQNGSAFTGLTQEMIQPNSGLITVDPATGRITIARDMNGDPDFPATLTITNLPAVTSGTQDTYGFTLTVADRSGNEATATDVANISGIRFDTIAPVITNLRSTLNGEGTTARPYYVGANRLLPLVLTVREENNSQPHRASTPVILRITSTNSGSFEYPDGNIVCTSLLADNTCTGARSLQVPEGFDGSIDMVVVDRGGNQSESKTINIRQDSDAPSWGPNGAIEAISPNGAAVLEPNTHFLSQTFTFRARDLINDDPEPETYANVTYTNTDGTEVTREHILMTRVPSTNNYTFNLTLEGLPYGTSTIRFAMEDVYGNRQSADASKTYTTFYDNRGPQINNFRYAFEDDDARISFDSITEDSYPVQLSLFQSTDGTNWTERSDVSIPAFNDATTGGFSTVIPNVPVGSEVRLEFRDSVQQYRADGTGFETAGTVETHFLMRDILLSVSINRANERMNVGYITPVDTTDLRNYAVSFTGPNGRTGHFDTITDFHPSAAVGTIEAPLMGDYVFTAILTKADGSVQTTTRTFHLGEDILRPRATFTLPTSDSVRFEDGTYYVNSDDPTLKFNYSFAPQQGTIYEESTPVMLNATGIDFSTSVSLNSITSANASGQFPVELVEDRVYNITLSATDNATSRNATSQQFRIVKDRSNPEVRLTPSVDGEPLTLIGNAPETDVLQTTSSTVDLAVAVDHELEPVAMEVRLNDTLQTERTALPTMIEDPYTQGFTYLLRNLNDNAVNTITVMVRDTSGHVTNQTLRIRRDNQAPTVTGDVRFVAASSSVNPVPFLPGLTVTDFTPVYYTILADNEVLTARTLFTGNAVLIPEGNHHNLQIIFSDALGNETSAYNPLPNDATDFYVDTVRPNFTLHMTPEEDRTREVQATLNVSNVDDAGDAVTVEIIQNGAPVVSTAMPHDKFVSGSGFTLPLAQNSTNTFEVRVRDGANNLSDIQTVSIIQDQEGPAVTGIAGITSEDNRTIKWDFDVTDRLGSEPSTVQVIYRDIESGRITASTPDMDAAPHFTLDTAVFYTGHSYELTVRATDSLGNINTVTSAPVSIPSNELDALDPRNDGPAIDPNITDTNINVIIRNGRDINYVAENLPRGTHVILGEVLANGKNTITNQQMDKIPAGIYVMEIRSTSTGELLQLIDPYVVHPYYTDPEGDLSGDGFGGGISDHKLVQQAETGGIYNTPALEARLAEIKTIIQNNISTRILEFLAH